VGAWPIDAERLKQYMEKAMREAKLHTSWVANNQEFEGALNSYIDAVLGDAPFVAEVGGFVERIAHAGHVNSLAQTLMKHTSPGLPDLYQGSELWDFSLVDPDNRRPVDYELRRKLLTEMESLDAAAVMAREREGLPKLWLIHRALHLRQQHPEWFGREAPYFALQATGDNAEHVVAYMRGENLLTVVPRWIVKLGGDWGDTSIEVPEGRWRNRLSDETFEGGPVGVKPLLSAFPVALLTRDS
jgi:(1->4)-alpha-D-glucan 1-alpha-D-glucosylmutase